MTAARMGAGAVRPVQWFFAVAFDGLFFALLYLWQFHGHEAAGSFLIGAMWFISAIGLIGVLKPSQLPRSFAFDAYQITSSLALILAIVYVGHVWLAAAYGFVWLCMTANRLNGPQP